MVERQATVQQFVARATSAASTAADAAAVAESSRPCRTAPLDIVIPIFNNAPCVRLCFDSLLPTLAEGDAVWLLDDASDEPDIPPLLDDFARRWPATQRVRNPSNLGFVGSSNRAFTMTRRDLVLLNSDTEVTAGWLEFLQDCLKRNPRAGIVCPLSDRATILSVLPDGDRSARIGIAAAAAAQTIGDVPLPTAVGFCMLIRRRLLVEIGPFSEAFAPGYGEENDLSMRALRAGWDILAADRACVFHRSGGSFTAEQSRQLQASHQARLDRIWPEYAPLVQSWWRDNPLRVTTERLAWRDDRRPALVHVLHRQYHVGGTERVVRTLIRGLAERYRHVLLYPGSTDNPWCDFEVRAAGPVRELMLNNRWIRPTTRIGGHGADFACPQAERALARAVRGSGARIVHFHHMLHWDTLLLPAVVRALGCRVVISVHDFWFNCPIHNQLEHATGQPCGRSRAEADARCSGCLGSYGLERHAVQEYAGTRHELIAAMLEQADAVIVPSEFIRGRLQAAYPAVSGSRVHVEPPGVSVPDAPASAATAPGCVLGYFGGDQVLKGAQLVLDLAQALADAGVTIRIYGRVKGFEPAALPPNVELRGFYDPDRLGEVMQGVDVALVPSYYEESFSMVTAECWAHGIPVIASRRGALGERVVPGVNGWLVPDMTPASWLHAVRHVLEGDTLERCRAQLPRHAVRSIGHSVEAHDRLYRSLLELPQPQQQPAAPVAAPARFSRKVESLRAEAAACGKPVLRRCLGVQRDHWGTAGYRVRFPLQDLARSHAVESCDFHVIRDAGFALGPALAASPARHVVVQPFLSDEGLRLMEFVHRATGRHLTLVVDDLWTELAEDNPARAAMPDDVPGRLAYAASLSQSLVLTTEELHRRLGLRHPCTHVIDNALPEWIWHGLPSSPPRQRGRLRVGWFGAPQHAADLAFLEPVMRATLDLADWVFLGLCPKALQPLASEVHPMVPFEHYPAKVAALRLDLAIAPLADTPFNRCKSHLKVLECGILGVPMIATDLEPYRHCPVPLAAPDDAANWTAQIRGLLEDDESRVALGRALRGWVLQHHLTQHRRANWQAALGLGADAG